jgi:type I restriction enzyme M protein
MNEDGEGVPIYRMNEMHDMLCDYSIMKSVEVTDKEKRLFALYDRDVLFNRTNSHQWVGRTGLYKGNEGERAIFASYLVRFRTDEASILPEFLTAFLSCKFGQQEVKRRSRQSVNQTNVNPEEVKEILIPVLGMDLQDRLKKSFHLANEARLAASGKISEAEETLLAALGLADWTPPEPLSYSGRASDAFAAGRLDAEHFRPKYAGVMAHIATAGVTNTTLDNLIEPLRNGVDLREFTETGTPYIRVGDIKHGRIEIDTAKRVSDSPASVKKSIHLRPGDILFTRKGSFGNAAVVSSEQTDAILSTEIMLLRLNARGQNEIVPDYLAAFFNSQLGRIQAEQWAHGVAFYSITQDDLYKFQIPIPDGAIQKSISTQLIEADRLRSRSREMLEAAKRAVEIAIEDGEDAALASLDATEGAG